jgi:hypothetical protein
MRNQKDSWLAPTNLMLHAREIASSLRSSH